MTQLHEIEFTPAHARARAHTHYTHTPGDTCPLRKAHIPPVNMQKKSKKNGVSSCVCLCVRLCEVRPHPRARTH